MREVGSELRTGAPYGGIPAEVDPYGENRELHTFVYEGPIFTRPATFRRGQVVQRDGFAFADLLDEQPGRA